MTSPDDTDDAPVTSTPTTAETLALIDAEFVPDEASRRAIATIRAVKVLGLVTLLGGGVGIVNVIVERDFGDLGLGTIVLTCSVLLVLVCTTPVLLLILGRRHRQRLVTRSAAASATAWGVVLLILGLLAVVPTLATAGLAA